MLIDRRRFFFGTGAAAFSASSSRIRSAVAKSARGPAVSVTDFGASPNSGQDDTRAIQAAIQAMERRGGGTVRIPGRFRCGNVRVSGQNVRLQGENGWLVDGRLIVDPQANNLAVSDLHLVDTRADRRTYLIDISGHDCTFTNIELVKDPPAAGYQMYIRQSSARCHFNQLKLRGSNGIMLAGSGHLFENFDFRSAASHGIGGDDAFAIKAIRGTTEGILIRNGTISGFAAIVSFGSEVGTPGGIGPPGAVRDVTVENVAADRCTRIAFFKPGALKYDYRNGIIDGVRLYNLSLSDLAGEQFTDGIEILAARGAVVRNIEATGIKIRARAKSAGVLPTAAVFIKLLDRGDRAHVENVLIGVSFVDPYAGVDHGPTSPGYPIDNVAKIAMDRPGAGVMSQVTLDLEATGTSFGGIAVGPGLDDAVTIRRAFLSKVALHPRSSVGAGGIWSSSRVRLGEVRIDAVHGSKLAGPAFQRQPY